MTICAPASGTNHCRPDDESPATTRADEAPTKAKGGKTQWGCLWFFPHICPILPKTPLLLSATLLIPTTTPLPFTHIQDGLHRLRLRRWPYPYVCLPPAALPDLRRGKFD